MSTELAWAAGLWDGQTRSDRVRAEATPPRAPGLRGEAKREAKKAYDRERYLRRKQ